MKSPAIAFVAAAGTFEPPVPSGPIVVTSLMPGWCLPPGMRYYSVVTLPGFLSADHWAVEAPIDPARPAIGSPFVNHDDCPREALFESLLRCVARALSAVSQYTVGTVPPGRALQ